MSTTFSKSNKMTDLILDTKTFHLSSRSSSCILLNDDYKSKFRFNIPDMIYRDESIEYINFSIPYAVIPNTFYTINDTNNTLVVIENDVPTTYVFENGNYNSNYFISKFKSNLGSRWGITLDVVNSTFTVTNSQNDFTFSDTSTIDSIMGFSTTISSTNQSLTMTRVCNFLPLPRIVLRCPELANGFMISSITSGDIIISIPNSSKINGEIIYQNYEAKHLLKAERLDTLTFSLTNDDGDFINFNGISSFFTIQFDIYRKRLERPPVFHEIQNMVQSVNLSRIPKL